MKPNPPRFLLRGGALTASLTLLAVLAAAPVEAATRTSASYSIATDSIDAGGRASGSANYSQNGGSLGAVAGVANNGAALPSEVAKTGYLGQLYEIIGFAVTAPTSGVNENATLQLGGAQVLDDLTLLPVPASAVTWSVASGPLSSISSAGLATAGTVYQNTAATARGVFNGRTATLNLAVLNVNLDDYGSYAGDGIDDAWQVQYFGLDNPLAGPGVDADGTGQTNLLKYLAGLDPLDPNSRFTLAIAPVAGQPGQKALTFSPRYDGRTYTLQSTTNLTSGGWSTVPSQTASDNGATRTVIDLAAGSAPRFYRVLISRP